MHVRLNHRKRLELPSKTWSSPFCLTMLCTTKTSAAAAGVPLGHGLHGPSVVVTVDCLWLELSWPWLLPPEQQLLGSFRVAIISSRREFVQMCGVIMSEIDGNNNLNLRKLCGGHSSIITCHKTASYLLCLCWCLVLVLTSCLCDLACQHPAPAIYWSFGRLAAHPHWSVIHWSPACCSRIWGSL